MGTTDLMNELSIIKVEYAKERIENRTLQKRYENIGKRWKIMLMIGVVLFIAWLTMGFYRTRLDEYICQLEANTQGWEAGVLATELHFSIQLRAALKEINSYVSILCIVFTVGTVVNIGNCWLNSDSDLADYVIDKWNMRTTLVRLRESNLRLERYQKKRMEIEQELLERGVKEEYLDRI